MVYIIMGGIGHGLYLGEDGLQGRLYRFWNQIKSIFIILGIILDVFSDVIHGYLIFDDDVIIP